MSAAEAAAATTVTATEDAAAFDNLNASTVLLTRIQVPNLAVWTNNTSHVSTLYSHNASNQTVKQRKAILVRFANYLVDTFHLTRDDRIVRLHHLFNWGREFLDQISVAVSTKTLYAQLLLGPILCHEPEFFGGDYGPGEQDEHVREDLALYLAQLYKDRDADELQRGENKRPLHASLMDPEIIIERGVKANSKRPLVMEAIIHLILMPVSVQLKDGTVLTAPLALRGSSAAKAGFKPSSDIELKLEEGIMVVHRMKNEKRKEAMGKEEGTVKEDTTFKLTDRVIKILRKVKAVRGEVEQLWSGTEASFSCALSNVIKAACKSLALPHCGKWLRRVRYTANTQALEKYGKAPEVVDALSAIHDHNAHHVANIYNVEADARDAGILRAYDALSAADAKHQEIVLDLRDYKGPETLAARRRYLRKKADCVDIGLNDAMPVLIKAYRDALAENGRITADSEFNHRLEVRNSLNQQIANLVQAFRIAAEQLFTTRTCLCGDSRPNHVIMHSCISGHDARRIEKYWNACKRLTEWQVMDSGPSYENMQEMDADQAEMEEVAAKHKLPPIEEEEDDHPPPSGSPCSPGEFSDSMEDEEEEEEEEYTTPAAPIKPSGRRRLEETYKNLTRAVNIMEQGQRATAEVMAANKEMLSSLRRFLEKTQPPAAKRAKRNLLSNFEQVGEEEKGGAAAAAAAAAAGGA